MNTQNVNTIDMVDSHSTTRSKGEVAAWLLVMAIICTAAALRAPITGVGSMIGTIQSETNLSYTMAGLLTTLPLIAFSIFAMIAPKLSRRFGFEPIFVVSMIVMSVGIVIRSLPLTSTLFAGTALIGIGIAVCNVLVTGFIKGKFEQKLGLMTGIYTASMNFWAAISSGISVPLSQTAIGWRGSLGIWVVVTIIAALIWLPQLIHKRQQEGTRNSQQDKAQARVMPQSSSNEVLNAHHTRKDTRKPFSIWKSSVAWQVSMFMGLQSVMFYIGIAWLPKIFNDQGISSENAGWMMFLMQMVSMISSFIMPLLAARVQSQSWLAVVSSATFLAGFGGVWLGSPTFAPLYVILIGLGCGTTFSLVIMFFNLRSRTTHQAAELSGMGQSIGYLISAIGPTFFGFIHDQSGGWNAPLATVVMMTILTMILGYFAGRKGYVSREE